MNERMEREAARVIRELIKRQQDWSIEIEVSPYDFTGPEADEIVNLVKTANILAFWNEKV